MLPKPSSTELIELFQSGLSTRQIAVKIGLSKSYTFKLLTQLGLTRSRSEAAILRQPPTSKHWRSSRQQARKVWERNVGPIPEGYHIHHKDNDFTNNALENLECLSAAEHMHITHAGPEFHIPRHLRSKRKEYMKAYLKEYSKRATKA